MENESSTVEGEAGHARGAEVAVGLPGGAPAPRGGGKGRKLLIGAGVAALLAVLGAGIAALVMTRVEPAELLVAFSEDGIPSRVSTVTAKPVSRLASRGAPTAFIDSKLAEIACGGADVASQLMAVRGQSLSELEASDGLAILSRPNLGRDLTCGRKVHASLVADELGVLNFEEDGQHHSLLLLRSEGADLPMPKHRFSGLAGFCEQAEGESDCLPDGHAVVSREGRWVYGATGAVEAYARAWTSTRKVESTHVEIARRLIESARGDGIVQLFVRPTSLPFWLACNEVRPAGLEEEFAGKCFPSDLDQLEESIGAKTRGLAFTVNYIEADDLDATRMVYTFLARDEDAATELERDVIDLHRDWLSHLYNHETALVRSVRESALRHRDHWETRLVLFVRALEEAEIDRDGDVVTLTLETDVSDSERSALRIDDEEWTRAAEAVASIIDALIGNKEPPLDALGRIYGPELAEWMALPRASASDCAALREKLGGLVAAGVPTEQFGLKYGLEQRFAEESCVGQPLTQALRACVEGADSLTAMDACEPPTPPFVKHWRTQLEGQWAVASLDSAPGYRGAARRNLEEMKLEVSGDRLAVRVGGVSIAPLEVTSSSTSEASIVLPFGTPRVTPKLVRLDDGRLRFVVANDMTATLRRATFDRSLFAEIAGVEHTQ